LSFLHMDFFHDNFFHSSFLHSSARVFACGIAVTAFCSVPALADAAGVVNDNGVNVRSSSSTASKIMTTLNQGSGVTVKKAADDFYQVALTGLDTAYISSQFVDIKTADAAATDSGVNIRQAPSTDSAIAGRLSLGDAVTVTGKSGDWFAVTFNGVSGYVIKDYLQGEFIDKVPSVNPPAGAPAANPAKPVTKYVINCPQGLNMRKDATTNSDIISAIQNGQAVQVTAQLDGWVKATVGNATGYISAEFLSDTQPKDGAPDKGSPDKSASPDKPASQPADKPAASADQSGGAQPANAQADGSDKAQQIISYAKQFIGTPYSWGGTSLRSGVDCSGFVYSIFRDNGIILDRSSSDMVADGPYVSKSDLRPGDLVFFDTNGSTNNGDISHVGVYIGDGKFIESSSSRKHWGVTISSLDSDYYARTYVTAARVIK